MNTEVLIVELSRNLQPVPLHGPRALLRRGLIRGAAVAMVLVLFWPSLAVRSDLSVAAVTMGFWMKLLYTASIASLGFFALERLSRPGARDLHWTRLLWPPIALLALVTSIQLAIAPDGNTASFWMGSSWFQCPLYVMLLSVPVFVGLVRAMAHLAPTRLEAAGAAAGLVAGATGASIYALHCAETSPGFVLLWYSLGLAAATLVGAAVGPRPLRW